MHPRVRRVLGSIVTDPVGLASRAARRARMARLRWVNRWSRRPVTGTAPAIVDLTSYGHRLQTVFYTLETIAAGSVRPRRLILWLDDQAVVADPPPRLRRLMARGLEVLGCPDYGPHKKQQPFVRGDDRSGLPLVTADDDLLYDRDWLEGLIAAHVRHPDDLLCYRGHTIGMDGGHVLPYTEWTPRMSDAASYAAMGTGVSGMLYPVAALDALRREGDGFATAAPFADDVWVHAVAVRAGIRSRQIQSRQRSFPELPGSQLGTLYRRNVVEGGNDPQIAASYTPDVLERIATDLRDGR